MGQPEPWIIIFGWVGPYLINLFVHMHVCVTRAYFGCYAVGWSTMAEVEGSDKTCSTVVQYPCDAKTCSGQCESSYGGYGICTSIYGSFVCLCTYHCWEGLLHSMVVSVATATSVVEVIKE